MPFTGFGSRLVAWFEGIERDNSKAYFDATRATFLSDVREPFEDLLDELSLEFHGEPKVFRQNRDVRFSPDKSPYKTRTYGILHGSGAAFYAAVSADGLYAGTGYWRMANDPLERYRAAAGDELAGARSAGLELSEPHAGATRRAFDEIDPFMLAQYGRRSLSWGESAWLYLARQSVHPQRPRAALVVRTARPTPPRRSRPLVGGDNTGRGDLPDLADCVVRTRGVDSDHVMALASESSSGAGA